MCLASFTQHHVFKVLQIVACAGALLLFTAESYFTVRMDHILFTHPPVEGHLGYLQPLVTVKSAAADMCVHVPVYLFSLISFYFLFFPLSLSCLTPPCPGTHPLDGMSLNRTCVSLCHRWCWESAHRTVGWSSVLEPGGHGDQSWLCHLPAGDLG